MQKGNDVLIKIGLVDKKIVATYHAENFGAFILKCSSHETQ